jgi:nicotinamide mononucleotide transporter
VLETAFTLFAAPVTWLEIAAFVCSLICVALNIKQIHWAWPFTIVASALYAWLFFVNKLYGDGALQFVFIASAFYGWWQWLFGKRGDASPLLPLYLRRKTWLFLALSWLILWLFIGAFLKKFTDTDVPWWDAFPTAGSLVATYLLAKKYVENWPVWIGVNAVGAALFAYKNLTLTAILYALFLLMAIAGWREWHAQVLKNDLKK